MSDRIGQQIGNYQLAKLLGRGGFAEVYLGEQIYLKTLAAIKLLQNQLEPIDLDAFLTEARIIANLAHPNIVRVLEFGEHEHTPYLVMDYAPAGTLRNLHPLGLQLTITQVVSYVRQVAAALQCAHDHKIVHRDVKPENMLVGRNGEILLSDFGIAVVSHSSRYHGRMDVGGTIAYMAPEQLQGKAGVASDQYALGIVVYEWLTGTRPFNGSFTEIGSQHIFAPPPSVCEKVPSISAEIDRVLQTALAKDPQHRYASIQAFADALEQASLMAGSGSNSASTYDNEYLVPTLRKTVTLSSNPLSTVSSSVEALSVQQMSAQGSLPSLPAHRLTKFASSHPGYRVVVGVLLFLLIASGIWSFFAFNKPGSTTGNIANGTAGTATLAQNSTGSTPLPTSTTTSTTNALMTKIILTITPTSTPTRLPMLAPTPTPTPSPRPTPTPVPPTLSISTQAPLSDGRVQAWQSTSHAHSIETRWTQSDGQWTAWITGAYPPSKAGVIGMSADTQQSITYFTVQLDDGSCWQQHKLSTSSASGWTSYYSC